MEEIRENNQEKLDVSNQSGCKTTILRKLGNILKKKSKLSYDEVSSLSRITRDHQGDDVSKTRIGDKEGVISKTGKEILPCEYTDVYWSENGRVILAKKDGKTGIWSISGKQLAPCMYDKIDDYDYSLELWKNNKMGLWVFPDEDKIFGKGGTQVMPCEYDDIENMGKDYGGDGKNDYYMVKKGNQFGALSSSGDPIIPCEYDDVSDFFAKMIKVKKGNKSGIISTSGKPMLSCDYDKIDLYDDNYSTYVFGVRIGNKQGIISTSGKVIIPCECDNIEFISNTTVSYSKGGKTQLKKIF